MAEFKINLKDLNTNTTLVRHKKIHRFKKIFGTMIGLKTSQVGMTTSQDFLTCDVYP